MTNLENEAPWRVQVRVLKFVQAMIQLRHCIDELGENAGDVRAACQRGFDDVRAAAEARFDGFERHIQSDPNMDAEARADLLAIFQEANVRLDLRSERPLSVGDLDLPGKTCAFLLGLGIKSVDALVAITGPELDALPGIRKYDREVVRRRLGAHALALRDEAVADPQISKHDVVPDVMPTGWTPTSLEKTIGGRFEARIEQSSPRSWHWRLVEKDPGLRTLAGHHTSCARAAQAAEITARALLAAEKGPAR